MEDNLEIYDLNKFYSEFVRRAYDEFLTSPTDQYRVKMAALQADTMAERVWDFFKDRDRSKIGNVTSAKNYRELLVSKECPDFQLVWDVHDGHKHVQLSRPGRQVSSAAQTGIRTRRGAFQPNAFGKGFDTGWTKAIVRLDDGTERVFSDVLRNVIEMWERLLPKLSN
jgi:hypothetical protein